MFRNSGNESSAGRLKVRNSLRRSAARVVETKTGTAGGREVRSRRRPFKNAAATSSSRVRGTFARQPCTFASSQGTGSAAGAIFFARNATTESSSAAARRCTVSFWSAVGRSCKFRRTAIAAGSRLRSASDRAARKNRRTRLLDSFFRRPSGSPPSHTNVIRYSVWFVRTRGRLKYASPVSTNRYSVVTDSCQSSAVVKTDQLHEPPVKCRHR